LVASRSRAVIKRMVLAVRLVFGSRRGLKGKLARIGRELMVARRHLGDRRFCGPSALIQNNRGRRAILRWRVARVSMHRSERVVVWI
jgi:hypothetical protein